MGGGITLESPPRAARLERVATGGGLVFETFPRASATGNSLLSSGQAQYASVYVYQGEIVTNLHVICSTGGSGQTLVKAGVRDNDASFTSLAATADVKDTLTGTGLLTLALSSAWTCTESGIYYVGILGVGGTQPTLARAGNVVTGAYAAVSGDKLAGSEGSQTDWDATVASMGNAFPFWIGAS